MKKLIVFMFSVVLLGSCSKPGCTDATAINYNPDATTDDGSCEFLILAIGDTYQGGIIFYLDGNGGGLIAAPTDQGETQWGCYGTTISGADGTAIGTGAQNTIDILAGCTTAGTAADICANLTLGGYSDWFLPSKDELGKIYQNRSAIGSLGNGSYLSSSEVDGSSVWERNFYFGYQNIFDKNRYGRVRAIRAF